MPWLQIYHVAVMFTTFFLFITWSKDNWKDILFKMWFLTIAIVSTLIVVTAAGYVVQR